MGFVNFEGIEGYDDQPENVLLQIEADLLYSLAKTTNVKGVIVNVGGFKGKSSIALACGSKESDKSEVFSIDRVEQKEFFENMKKFHVENIVFPIQGSSETIGLKWKQPIKLLFIDADHSYDSVRTDIRVWAKHLVKGGIVAFHDTEPKEFPPGLSSPTYDGPTRAVEEFINQSDDYGEVKLIGSIRYAKKVK